MVGDVDMIKLSEIKDALEDVDMNSRCYFNRKTNEILWSWDDNREYSTYHEEDEYNNDIIFMFDFFTKNDYDIMQDFIGTINDDSLKNELYSATRGKGSFNRFRDIIDSNGVTNDWYMFRDNEYKKIAKEWCINNKIEFEEDC